MISYFILDSEHRPVPADLMTWARWFESYDNRCVAVDHTKFHRISTIFLGIDHRSIEPGPAILFETMVFERESEIRQFKGRLYVAHEDVEQRRYSSWDDAVAGHQATLRRYQKAEEEAMQTEVK